MLQKFKETQPNHTLLYREAGQLNADCN